MKKQLVGFLVLLILFLCSCSKQQVKESGEYQLYYIDKEETKLIQKEFTPEGKNKKEMVESFVKALNADGEYTEYQRVLPQGVILQEYSFGEADQLILNFSIEYYSLLTGVREILTRAAIVKTFCQIPEIDSVEFYVNGQPFGTTGEVAVRTMMKASDFVDNAWDVSPFSHSEVVTAYFADITGQSLVEATREVSYDGLLSMEQLIMEQLIAGPVEGEYGMKRTLPAGTAVNSITTQDGICYVDLNEEFLTTMSEVSEEVTIYSVVNSLVELSNVNKVQFLIHGEKKKIYQTLAFDGLFERNLNLIMGEQ